MSVYKKIFLKIPRYHLYLALGGIISIAALVFVLTVGLAHAEDFLNAVLLKKR